MPVGRDICFSSEAAVDAGLDERYWPIPDGADRTGLLDALRRHVRDVHEVDVARAAEEAWKEAADRQGGSS
jgi:hypothetical protein